MTKPLARIDLHTHSTRSDGRGAPAQVMREAADAGLDVVALTDHDTVSGWPEAAATCKELGIDFVPGIEVTSRALIDQPDGSVEKFSVHMLAYYVDPTESALAATLEASVSNRVDRLKLITDLLAQDYDLDWSHVEEVLEGGKTAGRPAVADAMINRGLIGERAEFFDFVKPGSKYYVPNRGVPTPEEAIRLIRGAGGVPIIAHPMARGRGPLPGQPMPTAHFESLIEAGLGGFEAFHRDVAPHVSEWLQQLAFKHDLLLTGSSDYHGTGKPNLLGENLTEPEMFERLKLQARR
jgi:3',5'-nucleoside bisphosphate phosphatase